MDFEKFSDFEPFLSRDFNVVLDPDRPPLTLQLVEVTDLSDRNPTPPGTRDPFSLLFLGPVEFPLRQSMYTLKGREETTFRMFLVPVGVRGEEGLLYEAIFN